MNCPTYGGAALLLLFTATAFPAVAQEAGGDLAKQAQNPIANLISLPLQNNLNTGIGPFDRNQNTLNVQPVVPFNFGPVNLITRTIIPLVYRPVVTAESGSTSGLGDINATFFFSPAVAGTVTWGVGPALYVPSATDDALGSNKWSAGPSAVALAMPGKWLVGALVSNVWSFAGGSEDTEDVNSFLLQYFVNYNLPNQWYLVSAPILTANWKAADGDKWVVPVGGGFGKVFRVERQPLNAQFQAFWNAAHPEVPQVRPPIGELPPKDSSAAQWTLRFQLQLLFPR